MVAPNYAAARSQLAKSMGLGQQRRKNLDDGPSEARDLCGRAKQWLDVSAAPDRTRGQRVGHATFDMAFQNLTRTGHVP